MIFLSTCEVVDLAYKHPSAGSILLHHANPTHRMSPRRETSKCFHRPHHQCVPRRFSTAPVLYTVLERGEADEKRRQNICVFNVKPRHQNKNHSQGHRTCGYFSQAPVFIWLLLRVLLVTPLWMERKNCLLRGRVRLWCQELLYYIQRQP